MMKGLTRMMFVLEKRRFWEAAQCYCDPSRLQQHDSEIYIDPALNVTPRCRGSLKIYRKSCLDCTSPVAIQVEVRRMPNLKGHVQSEMGGSIIYVRSFPNTTYPRTGLGVYYTRAKKTTPHSFNASCPQFFNER
jgi:hypothetical protein